MPGPPADTAIAGAIIATIVPVFAIVALGWVLGGWRRIEAATLTRLAVDVCAPALVFTLFAQMRWEAHDPLLLTGGVVWIMALTGGAVLLARPLLAEPHRGVLLPVLFWNSGNMGLSIVRLGLGDEALGAAAIVFVAVATLNAFFGPWIAKGRGGGLHVLRMPLGWACILGGACSLGDVSVPAAVLEPIDMLGMMAIPLMLLTLGMTLRTLRVTALRDAVVVATCRMGLGLLAGVLFVNLFDVQGITRQVLLIESVLPPAVINVIFSRDHDAATSTVASAIVLGTLLSVVVLPLVLAGVL